jgi:UDP-N-acetylglucosamine--N-acetylmuramyl-(pentapeptide) pyrophosphoryl-undecaprenol N-acetylglucosamine transferase
VTSAPCVVVAAGGTGGHVVPALAFAEALEQAGACVRWVGTRRGVEGRLVPASGRPLLALDLRPWRGRWYRPFVFVPLLLVALVTLGRFFRRERPCAVVAFGGYASTAGALAAVLTRRPLVLHEQNLVPGWTSRLFAPWARRVFVTAEGVLGNRARVRVVGLPVREAFFALPPPETRFADRHGPLRLLVLGGSQGAQTLNRLVPEALGRLPPPRDVTVTHQTGAAGLEETRARYARIGVTAELAAFFDDMPARYAQADLAVCRAGASTLAELAAVGLGAVLVPYPHAVDDHQRTNALHHAEAGAALVLGEQDLDAERLAAVLAPLLAGRDRLRTMAVRARARARPEAAAVMVDEVLELCRARTPQGRRS